MRTEGQDPADSIAASYTVDMADQVDRLEDVVKERLMELRRQNPGVDEAKLLAQIVEEQVKTAGDSPMLRTKGTTLWTKPCSPWQPTAPRTRSLRCTRSTSPVR